MTRNERLKRAIEKQMSDTLAEVKAIWKRAEDEDRESTEDERLEAEEKLKAIEELKEQRSEVEANLKVEADVQRTAESIGPTKSALEPEDGKREPARPKAKSLGDQFVESKEYEAFREKGSQGKFSTGQVETDIMMGKATLLEGDNQFSGGTPGAAAPFVPLDVRPGYLPILEQPPTVADMFGQATTASNAVGNVKETVATNNADVVAEGTAKPESALEYELEQVPVRKIATWLPVSEEVLEDAPAIRAIINNRLTLFVRQEEDAQLLHGAGGGNFLGLLPQIPAANRYVTSSVANVQNADHIFEALTVARRSFLEPDTIVVNPEDWADLRLHKDGNENYIAGSPYSTGQGEPVERLWGKRLVVTQAIPAGTAAVGAFQAGATLFRKGGISVEATNSHEDFFTLNLVAIRAEERAALAVHRPSAFAIADIGYPS
jgi:HK97 family phage major capsid protein